MAGEPKIEDVLRQFPVAGAFKFGKGVMGKSTIVLVALLLVGGVAAFRSTLLGLAAFLTSAVICIAWFFAIRSFCIKYPDMALLDGAEWSGWKRFEARAKVKPAVIDVAPTFNPPLPPPPHDIPPDAAP
jgi:hypothetical protein